MTKRTKQELIAQIVTMLNAVIEVEAEQVRESVEKSSSARLGCLNIWEAWHEEAHTIFSVSCKSYE